MSKRYPTYLIIFFCFDLFSQPKGLTVAAGDAQIASSGSQMVIESTDQTILEWDSFSIASKEHLHFEQTGISPSVLNRVMGPDSSALLGKLSSNGKVFLINPAGILIGPDAQIQASSFIGSTFDIFNSSFLEEKELHFQGSSIESVINQGKICCVGGDILLIARSIKNEGVLDALQGRVLMGASYDVLFRPEGSQHLLIQASSSSDIENSGDIRAAIVELRASSNPYAKAISHSGNIRSISEKGGEIYLIAENGTCEFTGTAIASQGDCGGTVHVLGDHVHLLDNAQVDASGKNGGGTVLIGGDFQGKTPIIKNAKSVRVDKNTQVKADAIQKGNGGKVIFWSDEATFHYGQISARGGEEAGNGGLVEVSGDYLDYQGIADRRAPNGNAGELLLDPCAVIISTGTDVGNSFASNAYTFSSVDATINIPNLIQNLSLGNVTVDATASGSGTASITIANPIIGAGGGTGGTSWTDNNLTLNGGNSIIVDVSSPISWAGTGTLTMTTTSGPITINSGITNSSATTGFTAISMTAVSSGANAGIILASGGVLTTSGGDVVLNGTSSTSTTASHGVFFNSGSIITGAGNISVTGLVPVGATGASIYGISMATTNGMRSTSGGNITLSGISNGSGAGCFGVNTSNAWGSVGTPVTSGNIIFQNCIGGLCPNTWGIQVRAALVTSGSIIATNNIRSGNGSAGAGGFFTNSAVSSVGGGNINITGSCIASNAVAGNIVSGILINGAGSLSTNGNGTITLVGVSSPNVVGSAQTGVGIDIQGSVTTVNGDINVGGIVPVSSGIGAGVLIRIGLGLRSTTGNINVSGNSSSSSINAFGVNITTPWVPGTTGTITFGSTVTDGTITISGCTGGTGGTSSHGIYFQNTFTGNGNVVFTNCVGGASGGNGIILNFNLTTAGNIIATSSIIGQGSGGIGCAILNGLAATGVGRSIAITATATGTVGACHGLSLTGSGTLSTNGGGSITLVGTGGPSSTPSHGINYAVSSTISTVTGSGNISLTGVANGSARSNGVQFSSTTFGPKSTSGSITVSGISNSTYAGNASGITFMRGWLSPTTGTVTFSNCRGGNGPSAHGVEMQTFFSGMGDVVFTNCVGGSLRGNGVNIMNTFDTTGSVIATSSIIGRGDGGVGFATNSNFSVTGAAHNISITASSTGTTGNCHGISLTGGSFSTNSGGAITLIGTGGASSSASHGINITGASTNISTTSGNGTISLAGIASGSNANVGVNLAGSANSIASTSGIINISGTSASSGANSHGVSVNTNSWTTGTTGALTFGSTITDGTVTVAGCVGGSGASSHGINFATAVSTTGNLVATNSIQGGTGSDSVGFVPVAGVTVTGASSTIRITASSRGTTGASHGISITAGTISTTNASGGLIRLIGTGGNSSTASHGVNISGTGLVSTTTSNASILIGGIASGTGSAAGVGVNLAGSTNSITSGTGSINVSGTSSASGSSSYGVSVNTNSWTTGTTGALTFGSTITDGTVTVAGCVGGSGASSHGINFATAVSTTGNLVATNSIQGGTGSDSVGFAASGNVGATNGFIAIAASSLGTAGASYGISFSGTSFTALGNIDLIGTPGAGTGSFGNALANNIITSGGDVTIMGSTLLTGSTSIDTTNSGSVLGGGSIAFSGASTTIDGTLANTQALSLNAGTSGTISFEKTIGQITPLGALTIVSASTSPNAISLGANIIASPFAIMTASPTVLAASILIDSHGVAGGSILFGGNLDATTAGVETLDLIFNTSGNVIFSNPIGSTNRLGGLTITAE